MRIKPMSRVGLLTTATALSGLLAIEPPCPLTASTHRVAGDATASQAKKLTAQEVVQQHLEALGSQEARAAIGSRAVGGPAKFQVRVGGGGYLDGKGVILSVGRKLRHSIQLPQPEYTGEEFAFDGERATIGTLSTGRRTPLSQFLNQQTTPLKEGLLGGVLSTAWPLLQLEQSRPQLEYRGVKKLDAHEAHSLGYRARKGSSDLKVVLYFDVTSFRHVRTEYKFEVGSQLGVGPNDSTRVQESYFTLIEDFDDFKVVDGLTLPHRYKLQLSVQSPGGSLIHDWTVTVAQVSHKEKIDEQVFRIY